MIAYDWVAVDVRMTSNSRWWSCLHKSAYSECAELLDLVSITSRAENYLNSADFSVVKSHLVAKIFLFVTALNWLILRRCFIVWLWNLSFAMISKSSSSRLSFKIRQKRQSSLIHCNLNLALACCWDISSIMHREKIQTHIDCNNSKIAFLFRMLRDDRISKTSLRLLSCDSRVMRKTLTCRIYSWKSKDARIRYALIRLL